MKSVSVLLRQGKLLLAKGLLSEAEDCCVQAIGIDAENVEIYANLAISYWKQCRLEDAANTYIKCLSFQNLDATTMKQIASFLRLNRNNNAISFGKLADCFSDRVLNEFILAEYTNKVAITVLWDFRSQPYSIGDVILLNQVANFISFIHNIPEIKFTLLADKSNPARQSFIDLGLNENNYLDHITKLLPVFLISEKVSSLHLENNGQDVLEAIYEDNFVVWPPTPLFDSMIDLNVLSFKLLDLLYKKHNKIPEFKLRSSLSDWAIDFIKQHSNNLIPIAVQIRNTQNYNISRNSSINVWLELFRHCENKVPVTFFVICSASEVDDRLRTLDNVVVAKDYTTSVDQDLALVKESSAFMGVSSGPGTLAFFSYKPYSIVNLHIMEGMMPLLNKHNWGYSFHYSQRNQRLIENVETFDLLLKEITILIESIEPQKNCLSMDFVKKYHSELRI